MMRLKRCPFCGSMFSPYDATIHAYYGINPDCLEAVYRSRKVSSDQQLYVIRCNKCKYEVPPEIWNSRQSEDEKDAEIERLRDAIVKLQAAADPNVTIVSIVKQALAATAQGDNKQKGDTK